MSPRVNRRTGILALPILLVFGGCSSTPSASARRAPTSTADIPSRLSPELAADITIYAVGLVGTPYRYGGNTPDSGFDCSGLIGYVYQSRAGLATPRTVSRMQGWGLPVNTENVRSGDLVLFARNDEVTHAGIYVGAGRFVHAPSTGGEVRLDQLSSRYWSSQQVAFRRP
ncbi:MAG: C40 family peptidase [Rhodoferax sp.]